jgi:hypothetical protein
MKYKYKPDVGESLESTHRIFVSELGLEDQLTPRFLNESRLTRDSKFFTITGADMRYDFNVHRYGFS